MLVSYLNSHPNIICFREIFHAHGPNFGFEFDRVLDKKKLTLLRNDNSEAFLEKFVFNGFPSKVKAVGFKLIYWQALGNGESETMPRLLNAFEGLKIIHLTRTNKFDLFISKKAVQKTNKWIAFSSVEAHEHIKIKIQPEDLEKQMIRDSELENQFEKLLSNREVLRITYEEIIRNPGVELGKVASFLRLHAAPLITSTHKQLQKKNSEIVENYEELKLYFKGTEFEPFFDE